MPETAQEPSVLVFPLSLREAGDGPEKEMIRFTIVDRKELEEKRSIFLYTPNGTSVADGASYNSVDLGMIGGMMGIAEQVKSNMASGGVDGGKMTMLEAVQAPGMNVGSDLLQGLKNKVSAGTALGQALKMKAGEAANPFSSLAFAGTTARSFAFTFKMIPESEQEMEVARQIENTFRKFLYPKLHKSALALKYPPFWKIQFMKGADENKFLPFIHLSYLQALTATYNATGNVFHPDGAPTEIDIALTFVEAKALTREDLYSDMDDFKTTKYNYKRKSPMPQVTADDAVDAGVSAGQVVKDKITGAGP